MGDFWNGHANGAPPLGSVWSCPSGMSLQEALTPLQTHLGRVLLEMLSHIRGTVAQTSGTLAAAK